MAENIHAGHRQRLLESFQRDGFDGFSDVTILEFLLTFAIVRRDTNELSHRLLDRFGSLSGVLQADMPSLRSISGMSDRAAALLHTIPLLNLHVARSMQETVKVFSTTEACGQYLEAKMRTARQEEIWMLCLDGKCKLLDCRQVAQGSSNCATVPMRRVLEVAIACNATSVVLAHNHITGLALPSRDDISATKLLIRLLEQVDILLADHLIIADGDFISLRDSGLM